MFIQLHGYIVTYSPIGWVHNNKLIHDIVQKVDNICDTQRSLGIFI